MVWRDRRWGEAERWRKLQTVTRTTRSVHASRRCTGSTSACGPGWTSFRTKLATFQVTAESDDGHVRATVGPRGQLVKLVLDPRVYREPSAESLASKITATVQRATTKSVEEVQQLLAGYLPPGSGAVDFLKDNNFASLMRRHDAALREEAERDG